MDSKIIRNITIEEREISATKTVYTIEVIIIIILITAIQPNIKVEHSRQYSNCANGGKNCKFTKVVVAKQAASNFST